MSLKTEKKAGLNCSYHDLGLIGYDEAYAFQQSCVKEVLEGASDQIILCEHPAVITLGRLSNQKNIFTPSEDIQRQGVQLRSIDRGGDVTLHAPGQLVVYPIMNLNHHGKDLHRYLHHLEEVAIALLNEFDIVGQRHPSRTGVWVKDEKIVSIGIGVRKWVTYHGLGINVNTDLKLFRLIKPCGLDVQMTSLAQQKKAPVEMAAVKNVLKQCIQRVFQDE